MSHLIPYAGGKGTAFGFIVQMAECRYLVISGGFWEYFQQAQPKVLVLTASTSVPGSLEFQSDTATFRNLGELQKGRSFRTQRKKTRDRTTVTFRLGLGTSFSSWQTCGSSPLPTAWRWRILLHS